MRKLMELLLSLALVAGVQSAVAGPGGVAATGQPDRAMQQSGEQAREDAAERAMAAREEAEETSMAAREHSDEEMSEQATAMQARRDERKAMMGEHKASGEKTKGKKPWWKFWASDDEEEE